MSQHIRLSVRKYWAKIKKYTRKIYSGTFATVFRGKRLDNEFDKDRLHDKSAPEMYGYLAMEVETLTSIFVLIVRVEPLPFSMT